MNTCVSTDPSSESSSLIGNETTATKRAAETTLVKGATSVVTKNDESPSVNELTRAITAIGPTLVKRYISHQASACNQKVVDLNRSLELYLSSLESSQVDQTEGFSVGDLWSGLIWWRDEASWVGRVGLFSLSDVKLMACEIIRNYLLSVKEGVDQESLPDSLNKGLTGLLFKELTADSEAPGLRTIILKAVVKENENGTDTRKHAGF